MEKFIGSPMCIWGAVQLGTALQSDRAGPIYWKTSNVSIRRSFSWFGQISQKRLFLSLA